MMVPGVNIGGKGRKMWGDGVTINVSDIFTNNGMKYKKQNHRSGKAYNCPKK